MNKRIRLAGTGASRRDLRAPLLLLWLLCFAFLLTALLINQHRNR